MKRTLWRRVQVAVATLSVTAAGCATHAQRTADTGARPGLPPRTSLHASEEFEEAPRSVIHASDEAESRHVTSFGPETRPSYGWRMRDADGADDVRLEHPSKRRSVAPQDQPVAHPVDAIAGRNHRDDFEVAYADNSRWQESSDGRVRRTSSQGPEMRESLRVDARDAAPRNDVPPAPDEPARIDRALPGETAPPAGEILNLDSVLSLAGSQNPNVAFARERINEAYARVERAEVLWLPSIRAGVNYNHHEGIVQDAQGNILDISRSSLYGGLGANAVGAGSPAVPGLAAQFHLTDAIFQPKIAAHQAASRRFAATATRNDVLRNTAVAYLELLRAEQALAIANETLVNVQELADLTEDYARTGQGLKSDYERIQAELALRRNDVVSATENVRVASARLAQLLHADPSVPISTAEPVVAPLDILTDHGGPAEFVATGLSRRPELFEQRHLVCEAVERLRREKYAPLVPSILLGMSYGGMGGGNGSTIGNGGDRFDADAVAFWEVRNLGFGERAARDETSSLVRQARMRELVLLDQVAREVVEAHAQVMQRRTRIAIAEDGIAAALRSYELNEQRIRAAQGLPIEVLQSVQALAAARRSYLDAVIDYNIAQFELCRATGWFLE